MTFHYIRDVPLRSAKADQGDKNVIFFGARRLAVGLEKFTGTRGKPAGHPTARHCAGPFLLSPKEYPS
jgi:hypothetical protein